MKKPGRQSKSKSITNPQPQRTKRRVYKSEAERAHAQREQKRKWLAKRDGREYVPWPCPGTVSTTGTDGTQSEVDLLFTNNDQMLEAMRDVYFAMGGTKTLLKHMKDNPRDYAAMVQNLMKMEAAIEENKAKKGGGDDAKGVLVVMKGLSEDEKCPHCGKKVNDPVSTTKDAEMTTGPSETIDISSMASVLNPGMEPVIKEGGEW